MEIILASNNQNKVKEIKKILKNVDILTLSEINFLKEIEETGKTFKENAYIKAKTIYDIYHKPVIADDSGLCVEALNFEPGVYSHRYAGPKSTDDENNQLLIQNLKGISNRNAYYTCVICYYDGEKELYFEGKVDGIIIDEARGNNGFGYDPHFYIPSFNKTMAELKIDEKNTISHRFKALEMFKEKFDELFNSI